jgi:periplasmic copper chaperone A
MPRANRHNRAQIWGNLRPMRRLVLEIFAATALTLGAILALTPGVLANDVMVKEAFARASAFATAKAGVVYMTFTNNSAKADRLLSIATAASDTAQVHESTEKDGVATMKPIEALEIPAGGTVELKPGVLHIMLSGLKAPLKKGDMIKLELVFEQAGKVEVMAHVGDVAAGDHAHAEGSTGN